MDYTIDQFEVEAKKFPVVTRVDGFLVPVDVALFVASIRVSGVYIHSVSALHHEYTGTGTRVLILVGVTWEPKPCHYKLK